MKNAFKRAYKQAYQIAGVFKNDSLLNFLAQFGYWTEDGQDYYVTEDGKDYYVLESN